jgi:hypothetical protein
VNREASARIATGSSLDIEIALVIFVSLIASLLIDPYFGHQPAEIFGVV